MLDGGARVANAGAQVRRHFPTGHLTLLVLAAAISLIVLLIIWLL